MVTSFANSRAYRINEYLLVLSPPADLWKRIVDIKTDFADTYQSDHARWGKPHITLVNFLQFEMMETRIRNCLQELATGFCELEIELRDFGSFPSHTIYIDVHNRTLIQQMVAQIRAVAGKLMKLDKDHPPHFAIRPHLTIARRLQPLQFAQAWREYEGLRFSGDFMADSMLLLKRPVDDGPKGYCIAGSFRFENSPTLLTAGKLFE